MSGVPSVDPSSTTMTDRPWGQSEAMSDRSDGSIPAASL
jgi:hypothetical protein